MKKISVEVYYRCPMCGELAKDIVRVPEVDAELTSCPAFTTYPGNAKIFSPEYEGQVHVCSPIGVEINGIKLGEMPHAGRPRGHWQRIGHVILK